MTENTATRHILPCRHKGAEKRIYVVWNGDGDGKAELDEAMVLFGESEYDRNASPEVHFTRIANFLRERGFEEIKA